jgi:hypothetical protein
MGNRLDWPALEDRIAAEDLGATLYATLGGRALLPPALEARLRPQALDTAARNRWMMGELAAALATLAAGGVPVIVLKGADLALRLYGDLAARPMHDLDLLVPRADSAAAVERLASRGFVPLRAELVAGAALAWENEVALGRAGPMPTPLELHWSWLDSPHHQQVIPMAWVWSTAVPAPELGPEARVLGPEALLLYLCAHLALHHGRGGAYPWRWCLDVVGLLHRFGPTLDWAVVADRARASDLVLPMQRVVGHVRAAWAAPVPEAAMARLAALQPSPAEVRVVRALSAPRPGPAVRLWRDLAALPAWSARLRFGWHHLFPSPAYMSRRYGKHGRLGLAGAYARRWGNGVGQVLAWRGSSRRRGRRHE